MQAISGNPNAVVYCATSAEAYRAKRLSFGEYDGNPNAFVVYAENAAYFQSHFCGALERWLRGKPATHYEVGVAALTFAHEAGHLAGTRDERTVECQALASLEQTLRALFAVKNPRTIQAMIAAARESNRRRPYRCL